MLAPSGISTGTVIMPFPVLRGKPASAALWPAATLNSAATPFQISLLTCWMKERKEMSLPAAAAWLGEAW